MKSPQLKRAVLLAIPVLAAGGFVLDIFTPVGVTDWVWYFIPLLLTIFVRSRSLPFLLVALFSGLVLAGYYFSPPGIDPQIAIINNLMGICVLWLVAGLIFMHQGIQLSLRESETRYRTLFQSMQEGLIYCRMIYENGRPQDFIYLSANPAFERITGLKDVINKRVTEVIPGIKDMHPELFEIYGNVASTGQPHKFEYFLKASKIWLSVSTFSPGKGYFVNVFEDITSRKQAQESLNLFRTLVDNSNDMFEVVDPETGRFLDVNESVCRKLGYTREELSSLSVPDIDPFVLPTAWPQRREAIRKVRTMVFEGEHRRKDGTTFPIEVSVRWVDLERGYIVAVARDISNQRALESQFRQAQKMEAIGQLAGGVAHDFNNILAVIQMQSDLMKAGEDLSPAQKESVDEINGAAQRATALTRQLLVFSRKETMRMQDLELNESVNNLTKMLRRTIGEDIRIQFKFHPHSLFVRADPSMLDQVLMNLVVNARDAMPNGGDLVIETSVMEFDDMNVSQSPQARPGSFACLTVSDTGCGIPPEYLQRIFEPFFTTKEVGKGTGLGLATVFGIVQRHEGWINVHSENGLGTLFQIYLPRLEKMSGQKIEQSAPATLRGGHEPILLVEDDAFLRSSLHKTLLQLGYPVFEAVNGVEALEIWKQRHDEISLLLTDLVMPGGITGIDLGKRLLNEKPKLKVIYASGYSAEVAGRDFPLKEGVNFLNKPFKTASLAQTLRALLDA